MKPVLMTVSMLALAAVLLLPLLFFADAIALVRMQWYLLAVTVAWFIITPLWMGRSVTREEPEG